MILAFLQASLGAIGPQALPPAGCAAYLWSRSETPQLVGMVVAEPASLRLNIGGRTLDLPRTGADGATARGFATSARFAAGDIAASVELSATERPDLADGALIQEATMTVTRPGQDTIVMPLGGLIGCQPRGGTR